MIGVDAEHIALAGSAQVSLDVADTIDAIGRNPTERHASRDRALDHRGGKPRLGRKADIARHVSGFQASGIIGPALRQIERAIDEGMAVTRHVGSKNTDLAVRYFARRTGILPRHPARRLALLEKAGFIDHQHRIRVRKMLDDIVAHQVTQRIGIPPVTAQERLLPPRTRIARRFRAHPSGLATLVAKQPVYEQSRVQRCTLLREQWTHPCSSPPAATMPIAQASPQSMLPSSMISESW